MSILIKNGLIITQNAKHEILKGDVYIEDDTITQLSEKPLRVEADYKIKAEGGWVLPGLINTHTHIPMTLLRGYADDMPLKRWLEECIWPVEAKLKPDHIKAGTRLGLLEMISSGTTSYLDMYFYEDIIGEVTMHAGVRGFLGFPLIDFDTPEYRKDYMIKGCESFIKKWRSNSIITPLVAPHSAYTCSPETLREAFELSERYDTLLHTHCSETREEVYDVEQRYGARPVEHLKKHGLLSHRMILAHCGWITKNEILDMKLGFVSVSHCPVSNMKIATGGYAPLPELLEADVPVGLGTDGAASNNTLDMFETMKFCALMHKHHRWDPTILPAQMVLDLATRDGARCLRMEDKLGSLEEGKKADVIIIDSRNARFTPLHDPVSHIVYAARGSDVSHVIVNGKPLMMDYEFLTMDHDKIIADAERYAKDLVGSNTD